MIDKKISGQELATRAKSWKFWKPIIFVMGGILLGYLYYFYIGCQSGTCPITSNPYGSMLVGGVVGWLLSK
ncbi:MAG: DUF6132 family protein [Bacteroidales bacterium]